MRKCPCCGIKTNRLGFVSDTGRSFLGKNYGKIACFDCIHKIREGKEIVWVGEPTRNELKMQALLKKHGYDIKPRIIRLYPSYWQRASGAWTWYCEQKDSIFHIGGQTTVKQILNAKKISIKTISSAIEVDTINDIPLVKK